MSVAVLYHRDSDGFGAAYAHWALGQEALYVSVMYDEPFPELPPEVDVVYILDFSYSREICLSLLTRFKKFVVIDHHKSAEEAIGDLPCTIYNSKKSGAALAWEYFHPGKELPVLLRYVQDYDLWRFQLCDSREVNAYIETLPRDFVVWDRFDVATAMTCGERIIELANKAVKRMKKRIQLTQLAGHQICQVNATEYISEIGNELCKLHPEFPFSAVYYDSSETERKYSLRSIGDFDVSEIAKQFGGGGHRNASGFTLNCKET